MCSFILTNFFIEDIDKSNKYAKYRGPDCTSNLYVDCFHLIHNLLHVTGKLINHPLNHKDIFCLYNGEIYNYKDFGKYNNDGECIIDLYKEYGYNFIKKIDGEFAIVLLDFKENLLIVSTDIFATKPL